MHNHSYEHSYLSKSDTLDVDSSDVIVKNTSSELEITPTVVNGILKFENFNDFNAYIEDTRVKSESAIDNIIENYSGFNSLKTYWDNQTANTGSGYMTYIEDRIVDLYFESILNEDWRFRVADTVYEINLMEDSIYAFLVDEENVINTQAFRSKSASACPCSGSAKCNNVVTNEKITGGTVKEIGIKWVYSFGVYASLGYSSKVERYNVSNNKWEKSEVRWVWAYQDEYYKVTYWSWLPWGGTQSNPRIYNENKARVAIDDHTVSHTIKFTTTPILSDGFCVSEFGRTHNWECSGAVITDCWDDNYWNTDAHVDNW